MAHWEHGYRTHGYWANDLLRLGTVDLGPRGLWDGMYRWSVDVTNESGEARTLRTAKRQVEQRVRGETKKARREMREKLSPAMQELLAAMRRGVVVRTPWGQPTHAFGEYGIGFCTKQVKALLRRGLIEECARTRAGSCRWRVVESKEGE